VARARDRSAPYGLNGCCEALTLPEVTWGYGQKRDGVVYEDRVRIETQMARFSSRPVIGGDSRTPGISKCNGKIDDASTGASESDRECSIFRSILAEGVSLPASPY